MKKCKLGVVVVLLMLTGCVGTQLKLTTSSLIPTLRAIERAQILDNLGRFLDDPTAVPVQVCITGGGVQVADQAQPTFKFPFHGMATEADLQLQGQLTENWSLSPVCDGDDLRRLRALYRHAIGAVGDDDFKNEYPPVPEKDEKGNPTTVRNPDGSYSIKPIATNPMFNPYSKYIGRKFVESRQTDKTMISCGVHQGKQVWITSEADLDNFIMWVSAATANTTSPGAGGGKGKPGQILLNAIQ